MEGVSELTLACQTGIKGVPAKGGVASRRLLVSLDSPQRHSGSAEKRQDPPEGFHSDCSAIDLHGQTDLSDTTRSFPPQIMSSFSGRIPLFLRLLSHQLSPAYCTDGGLIPIKVEEVLGKPVSLAATFH